MLRTSGHPETHHYHHGGGQREGEPPPHSLVQRKKEVWQGFCDGPPSGELMCVSIIYVLDFYYQEHLGSGSVILRLSGPLKECYAREHGLDFEKMLSASDYKEKYTSQKP